MQSTTFGRLCIKQIIDLRRAYLCPKKGEHYNAFELKAPLPNSDQTKVSKEKMFKLLAMNERPIQGAYYALPYNPYGKSKEDYAWTFPARWFDMKHDECVLIGEEYWDMIGGKRYLSVFHKGNQ